MTKSKRISDYRKRTLKELVCAYAYESGRIEEKEKKSTQKHIVLEVYARVKDTFDLLDKNPEAAEQIYKQLIEF